MNIHQQEYRYIEKGIVTSVWRGVIVGIVAGAVVSFFRWSIEHLFHFFLTYYQLAQKQPLYLLGILAVYLVFSLVIAQLIKADPDIKGSGIPQVEAELKGLMSMRTWSILIRKLIAGILGIASGLMLGREGPSIQLGAAAGKSLTLLFGSSKIEKRTLIASGAAAGLAAAFNAPIAGLLFVVEEVYHHFSKQVWMTAIVASLTANFVSLNIFGLVPVLHMASQSPVPRLQDYWLYLLLGILLGGMGYIYEWVVLRISTVYDWLGKKLHLAPAYYSLIAFVLILPIGYWFPNLLGGGNGLIVHLPQELPIFSLALSYFVIRFIWSMISYGSGLPGGIFLPILTLGATLGMTAGRLALDLGWIVSDQLTLFVVLGMAGYFAAISKAPLTAILLVTEMVGDLHQLMPLAFVAIVAYIIMDLLKGEPVYEAMLDKLLPDQMDEDPDMTLTEVIVSEKLADRKVSELGLPKDVLITSRRHNGFQQVVRGDTVLRVGDSIYVALPVDQLAYFKDRYVDTD